MILLFQVFMGLDNNAYHNKLNIHNKIKWNNNNFLNNKKKLYICNKKLKTISQINNNSNHNYKNN